MSKMLSRSNITSWIRERLTFKDLNSSMERPKSLKCSVIEAYRFWHPRSNTIPNSLSRTLRDKTGMGMVYSILMAFKQVSALPKSAWVTLNCMKSSTSFATIKKRLPTRRGSPIWRQDSLSTSDTVRNILQPVLPLSLTLSRILIATTTLTSLWSTGTLSLWQSSSQPRLRSKTTFWANSSISALSSIW